MGQIAPDFDKISFFKEQQSFARCLRVRLAGELDSRLVESLNSLDAQAIYLVVHAAYNLDALQPSVESRANQLSKSSMNNWKKALTASYGQEAAALLPREVEKAVEFDCLSILMVSALSEQIRRFSLSRKKLRLQSNITSIFFDKILFIIEQSFSKVCQNQEHFKQN